MAESLQGGSTSLRMRSQEGHECSQVFCLAEADLDFSAAPQALYPDGQFEGFAHDARGFVELVRGRATSLVHGMGRFAGAAEQFADQLLGLSDGELLVLYPLC